MAKFMKLHLSKNSPTIMSNYAKKNKQTKKNLSVMQINQDAICQFMIVVGSKFVMNTIELHYKNPFVGPILLELHFRS